MLLSYAWVTLALTYAADAADKTSVFVRPNRNDSYLIRNVRTYTCTIHRAPAEDPQSSFHYCQNSGTDEKPAMVGNSIRICPYLIGLFRN